MTKEAMIEARYMVLHPSQSLAEEAARQLIPDGRDFSRNLVVFPGKRPAHFLRKIIAQAVGSGYIPPAILSMEELMDRVYEKIDGNATGKLETIDADSLPFRPPQVDGEAPGRAGIPKSGGVFPARPAHIPGYRGAFDRRRKACPPAPGRAVVSGAPAAAGGRRSSIPIVLLREVLSHR